MVPVKAKTPFRHVILVSFPPLILGLSAFLLGFWSKRHNVASDLIAAPSALDLGELIEQRAYRCAVPLTNTTDTDLTIDDFAVSCNCVSLRPRGKVVIPAKQTRTIDLVVDLCRDDENKSSEPYKKVNFDLVPFVVGASDRHNGWVLHGRVRRPFSFAHRFINFEDSCIHGLRYPTKQLELVATCELSAVEALCEPEGAANVIIRSSTGDRRYRLEVSPKQELQPGPFSFDVVVKARLAAENKESQAIFPVRGIVRHDVQVYPQRIAFGPSKVGSVLEENVTVFSATGRDFDVSVVPNKHNHITVTGLEKSGNRQSFLIRYQVVDLGDVAACVAFEITRGGRTVTCPSVEIGAFGVADACATAP